MRRLVELVLAGDAHIAAVGEVNAPHLAEPPGHGGEIIVGSRAERPGAERHAVRRAVDKPHEPLEVRAAADDPRQPEDGPGWIVGMDRHPNAGFLGDRHHALEEVG